MIEKFGRREYWEKSQTTSRPYEAYEYFLDLKKGELQGKDILDLGSGEKEEFKKGVEKRGIEAQVFSVNPKLGPDTPESELARKKSSGEKVVAGIAQEMPFKDKKFDLIVSLDAVPLYLPSRESDSEYMQAFKEMDRVLSDGGIIKIYPVNKRDYDNNGQALLKKPLEYFSDKGYKITWKEFKLDKELMEKYLTTGGWQLILKKPER